MRSEILRYRHEVGEEGYQARYYSAIFELTVIAAALDVTYQSVNAACAHLHAAQRIVGYRLVGEQRPSRAYAIALRDE